MGGLIAMSTEKKPVQKDILKSLDGLLKHQARTKKTKRDQKKCQNWQKKTRQKKIPKRAQLHHPIA